MIKKLFKLGIIFCFVSLYSQEKKDFFVGAEIGLNSNQSDYINNSAETSLQGGILAEYFFDKNFSVMGKLKYFKSDVYFYSSDIVGTGLFGPQISQIPNEYNGKIISIPISINYNFKIIKNLSGIVRIGPSFNFETSSNYNFDPKVNKDFSKTFIGLNYGVNLNYQLSNAIMFVGLEPIFGANRGKDSGKDFNNKTQSQRYGMENYLFNFGLKYNLKNSKKK